MKKFRNYGGLKFYTSSAKFFFNSSKTNNNADVFNINKKITWQNEL